MGDEDRKIPRVRANDYTADAASRRRTFVERETGVSLDHVGRFSIDPAVLPGNVEHFTGVAQVPIGIAGPLLVNGEHARGEFFVPLATTEGTLVASYNRGMKLLRAAGGVTTTVCDDAMQRAPVFMFADARQAREFGRWIEQQFDAIKAAAETTTRTGKLRDIEQYSASRFRYLRFNYTTGDAAGQNMVGKATLVACNWIRANYPGTILHLPARGEFRDRQEGIADQRAAHARQARDRRGDAAGPPRARDHEHGRGDAVPGAAGEPPGRFPVGCQQQRRALGQRDHGHLHRDRAGCRERRGVVHCAGACRGDA